MNAEQWRYLFFSLHGLGTPQQQPLLPDHSAQEAPPSPAPAGEHRESPRAQETLAQRRERLARLKEAIRQQQAAVEVRAPLLPLLVRALSAPGSVQALSADWQPKTALRSSWVADYQALLAYGTALLSFCIVGWCVRASRLHFMGVQTHGFISPTLPVLAAAGAQAGANDHRGRSAACRASG